MFLGAGSNATAATSSTQADAMRILFGGDDDDTARRRGCEYIAYPPLSQLACYAPLANPHLPPPDVVVLTARQQQSLTSQGWGAYGRFERSRRDRLRTREPDLFIGQVPHLMPAQYLAFVLDVALGEKAVRFIRVLPRKTSALVWLESPCGRCAADSVTTLNGRVVFDIAGFFVLQPEAAAAWQAHVSAEAQQLDAARLQGAHDQRLPNRPLVVELADTAGRNTSRGT
jgi:hypothetical protein